MSRFFPITKGVVRMATVNKDSVLRVGKRIAFICVEEI